MDVLLFDRVRYDLLYNCSSYHIEDIPLANRQDIVGGIIFIAMFVGYELLYLPCLYVISKHLDQACYKFMLFIGIVDVLCLLVNALLHGYFAIEGAVFCSHPMLIYVAGCWGFFCWAGESTAAILLAINRCVEVAFPKLADTLYKGARCWLWLILPVLYGFYLCFFTKPALFSGLYFSWFFNPHVGYQADLGAVYNNPAQAIHNWIVLIGLCSAYSLFSLIFGKNFCHGAVWTSLIQKMSFLQIVAISAVNAITSLIYIYMQFGLVTPFVIYLGSFLWVTVHGMPCLIYLTVNRTIRTEFLAMFGIGPPKKGNGKAPMSTVKLVSGTAASGEGTTPQGTNMVMIKMPRSTTKVQPVA